MNEPPPGRRLGRGLAALIGDVNSPTPEPANQLAPDRVVPIELVSPNPRNPRRSFDEADLIDLAQSIQKHGVVQPVVVRPSPEQVGRYEIIAGERRWRAAQKAGLVELPIIVRNVDNRTALELAIIENVQRADLNPVEEAQGYQQLIDEHGYSQADLGQVIGKSRSHVTNTLRLLKLPDMVHDMLINGTLSAGHARTLVTADDPAEVARHIVENGLSVRQAEALAQTPAAERPAVSRPATAGKDPDALLLEKQLSDAIGMRVTIGLKGSVGELKLVCGSLKPLEELCRRLGQR
jgi:ParB family chromosome partitioning protein